MDADLKQQTTARRNLLIRMDRYMRAIEKEGLQPTADAMVNLVIALECLERADYRGGEDAMMYAEKGFPPRFARELGPISTTAALVETFERLRAEGE